MGEEDTAGVGEGEEDVELALVDEDCFRLLGDEFVLDFGRKRFPKLEIQEARGEVTACSTALCEEAEDDTFGGSVDDVDVEELVCDGKETVGIRPRSPSDPTIFGAVVDRETLADAETPTGTVDMEIGAPDAAE
jgi:hypothetical protein